MWSFLPKVKVEVAIDDSALDQCLEAMQGGQHRQS
jgi:hypothetical protein